MFADQLISYRRIRIANGSLSNGKCHLNTKHCIDLQIEKLFFIVYVQEGYFFHRTLPKTRENHDSQIHGAMGVESMKSITHYPCVS